MLTRPALSAREFLDTLASSPAAIEAEDVAVVVAHPDDETVGCAGILQKLAGATVIVVTDGAPRNLADARKYGFTTAAAYAMARRDELERAMSLVGISAPKLVCLGIPDQQAAFVLAPLARALAFLLAWRGVNTIFTHAYEGGHPDHDAAAFAVHGAARLLRRRGIEPLLIEMPFYHLYETAPVVQRFAHDHTSGEVAIPLSPAAEGMKRQMIATYATQASVLAPFAANIERFRPSPDYDFAQLPNRGALLYERYDWGMSSKLWEPLAADALMEL
jgi:LmbE family N-acetylglucosaminyl deacetylase